MGCFASLCPVADDMGTLNKTKTDDQSTLLGQEQKTEAEANFVVATIPTPLLKDINFAAIADEEPDDSSESVDDDQIEKLLREEEETAEDSASIE